MQLLPRECGARLLLLWRWPHRMITGLLDGVEFLGRQRPEAIKQGGRHRPGLFTEAMIPLGWLYQNHFTPIHSGPKL